MPYDRHARSFRRLSAVLLVAVLAGCGHVAAEGGARVDMNRITNDELLSVENARSLYEVVERLRPRWLTSRAAAGGHGTEIVVFQGQSFLGEVEVLAQLAPSTAYSLRFLDAATATNSLPGMGSRRIGGAIVIETTARTR